MLEEVLRKALRQADQAEVFFTQSKETPVIFEANRLKEAMTRQTSGVTLRLIKNGHIGVSSTSNLSDVDGLVARALETVPFGVKAAFELPGPQAVPQVPVYDLAVEALSVEQMAQQGQAVVDRLGRRWKEVLWECHVTKVASTVRLLNSRGLQVEYTKSAHGLGVEGSWVRDTDMLFVGDSASSCHPIADTRDMEASLDEELEQAQTIVEAPNGEVPVVFTPHGVAGLLLEPLLAGINGRNVIQGTSPLGEKLGQQVVSPQVTIWDDPTMPFVSGSRPWDDEGVPSQRTPLIEAGVVRTFLYDLQTAGQAKAKSTGSASRAMGGLPSPAPSVIVIQPGATPYSEMLRQLDEGLVVVTPLGAGQSNVLGGYFSANVLLGYRVSRGRVVGRVKNTVVSGNVYQALGQVKAMSKEARWVGGSLYTPALCCTGVHVSSKG